MYTGSLIDGQILSHISTQLSPDFTPLSCLCSRQLESIIRDDLMQ